MAIEQRSTEVIEATPIASGRGGPPARIQLLRLGDNPGRDGVRVYRVDGLDHARRIIAASNAYHGATQPVVDYDHQSVYGAKDGVGGRAPAAGWITGLSADASGIWGTVEWTKPAVAALADRQYRYISPYFGHDAAGNVTRIFNAALTNRPELELKAAASQDGRRSAAIAQSVLTVEERAVCAQMGVAEADFLSCRASAIARETAEQRAVASARQHRALASATGGLTPDERAICAQTGVSEAAFVRSRDEAAS